MFIHGSLVVSEPRSWVSRALETRSFLGLKKWCQGLGLDLETHGRGLDLDLV